MTPYDLHFLHYDAVQFVPYQSFFLREQVTLLSV
jgi:hypothetical protein